MSRKCQFLTFSHKKKFPKKKILNFFFFFFRFKTSLICWCELITPYPNLILHSVKSNQNANTQVYTNIKKFKWHHKCVSENYPDFNLNSTWTDKTKTSIKLCPECEALMEAPRILKWMIIFSFETESNTQPNTEDFEKLEIHLKKRIFYATNLIVSMTWY